MLIDRLIDNILKLNNPTAVGLDTCLEYLPQDMLKGVKDFKDAADKIIEFNKAITDNIADIVPSVKIQVAYYEMYGVEGMRAFKDTVDYAKKCGFITIADVKRNDIGSTAKCYSDAYIGKTSIAGVKKPVFDADFLTVNAYLGYDGIKPFAEDCKEYDKGLFALVKTSNPSGGEIQDLICQDGQKVYEKMGSLVMDWGKNLIGKYGYSNIGAVVGATYSEEAKALREKLKSVFFLIPGYGAQGGTAKDLAVCFKDGIGGVVNSSRAILTAYKNPKYSEFNYYQAARKAAIDMKEDLQRALSL